jgi:hypothetical protein
MKHVLMPARGQLSRCSKVDIGLTVSRANIWQIGMEMFIFVGGSWYQPDYV